MKGFDASGRAEYGSFGTKEVTGLINAGDDHYGAIFDGAWMDTNGINIAHNGTRMTAIATPASAFRAKADLSDTDPLHCRAASR